MDYRPLLRQDVTESGSGKPDLREGREIYPNACYRTTTSTDRDPVQPANRSPRPDGWAEYVTEVPSVKLTL